MLVLQRERIQLHQLSFTASVTMQWLAIESAGDDASQLQAFQKRWSLKEVSMSA